MITINLGKNFTNRALSAGFLLVGAGLCIQPADAALLIGFSQNGSDVVAVTSGTLEVFSPSSMASTGDLSGGADNLFGLDSGLINVVTGGVASTSTLIASPTDFNGDSFGFDGVSVFFGGDVSREIELGTGGVLINVLEPETTFIWENTTLAAIGLGALSNTPEIVYTSGAGDNISFVSVVPEPSSIMMLALGAFGFTLRRKR